MGVIVGDSRLSCALRNARDVNRALLMPFVCSFYRSVICLIIDQITIFRSEAYMSMSVHVCTYSLLNQFHYQRTMSDLEEILVLPYATHSCRRVRMEWWVYIGHWETFCFGCP